MFLRSAASVARYKTLRCISRSSANFTTSIPSAYSGSPRRQQQPDELDVLLHAIQRKVRGKSGGETPVAKESGEPTKFDQQAPVEPEGRLSSSTKSGRAIPTERERTQPYEFERETYIERDRLRRQFDREASFERDRVVSAQLEQNLHTSEGRRISSSTTSKAFIPSKENSWNSGPEISDDRVGSQSNADEQALAPSLKSWSSLISQGMPSDGKRQWQGDGGTEAKKRGKFNDSTHKNKSKRQRNQPDSVGDIKWTEGGNEDVLLCDIQYLLNQQSIDIDKEKPKDALPELMSELEVTVSEHSSSGDGLALSADKQHVFVVPFTVPGDTVQIKVFRHVPEHNYSVADLQKVVQPSKERDDSLIGCKYFASCAGCQLQMMPHQNQLDYKRNIVINAYHRFIGLDPTTLPEVEPTLPSPLGYGYRTKMTPHFDGPPGSLRRRSRGNARHETVPPIGFQMKSRRITLDIEDCPLGTDSVRKGLKEERARVGRELDTYRRGATLLIRETTDRIPIAKAEEVSKTKKAIEVVKTDKFWDLKKYETNPKGTIKEYVGEYLLTQCANSFFQNNNSILSPCIDYIKERILSPTEDGTPLKYLVDAYCGSGLFTITLSSLLQHSIGIDIDPQAIAFATENARLNNLPKDQAVFLAATASEIFAKITFPAKETVLVIDPPRKGCDQSFLSQLLRYGPRRILYVSCNVHSQARDVAILMKGIPGLDAGYGEGQGAYEVASIRGCDFFPQTAHVESIAVLQKKKKVAVASI